MIKEFGWQTARKVLVPKVYWYLVREREKYSSEEAFIEWALEYLGIKKDAKN